MLRPGGERVRADGVREDASLALPEMPALAEPLPQVNARPAITHTDGGAPFTLAGRRGFAAGTLDGAADVWLHPLCVMMALRVDAAFREAAVTPASVERRLDAGGRAVVEKLFIPLELPAAVLEWSAPDGAELRVEWTTGPWPAQPDLTGAPAALRWRRDGRALLVRADEQHHAALFAFSREPDALEVDDDAEAASPAIRVRLTLRLAPGENVRLAVVCTTEGDDDLAATLAALRSVPALVRARAGALARLSASTISVSAPDPLAAEALEWAKARLDAYRAETPGVGRSLVAGYRTSRSGDNDGQPGHPRYSTRDAVWTALASLAAGQFDAAAEVLRFLGQHQDASGEIPRECAAGGIAHRGAADSTPLYLLLAARYAAWTGDLGLLREQWTRILAAYRFCLGADTDADGLIESPRTGHGPIEQDRLGGGRVAFHDAGIRAAALAELVAVAEALGEPALAAELNQRAARARRAIEQRFHDAARGVYALELGGGPDAAPDWTQTAEHAVPLLLGAVSPERMRAWLDLAAGDGFTGARGMRMIATGEPAHRSEGEHDAAASPLHAGWVSWAEYVAGRSGAAFRHWWLNVEQSRGRGNAVRHGSGQRGIDVCPDLAVATAMVVAPLVYGLLGAEPDAMRHRLRLRPQPPVAWDWLDVERLRVGDAEVALRYHRDGARHTFIAEQTSGPVPLRLVLEPALPARRLAAARVDGRDAQLDARPFGERLLVPVQIVLDHERSLEIDVEDATTDDAA